MANLLHIRIGKGLKKKMEVLIDKGMFSNQAELIREGLREVLIKYKEEQKIEDFPTSKSKDFEELKKEKIEKRKQEK